MWPSTACSLSSCPKYWPSTACLQPPPRCCCPSRLWVYQQWCRGGGGNTRPCPTVRDCTVVSFRFTHDTVTVMPDTVCTCVCRPRLRPLRDLLPVVPAENGAQWSFICQARVAGLMAISLLASFNSPNYLFRVCSSVAACICSLNMLQARLLGRYWQESFVPDTSQTIRYLGSALSSFWCSYSSYSEDL